MKEQKIQTFVDIIKNYFAGLSADELIVDTPYLFEGDKPKVYDYTGVIGISGVMKGVVYFTASEKLLCGVLEDLGEGNDSETMIVDLVGEIANTVAGNARRDFGSEFNISTPLLFRGVPESIILPKGGRAFIIPITWREQAGEIVVCLQDLSHYE